MVDKSTLTQSLLDRLDPEDRPSLRMAIQTWWQDHRKDGGLRLSPMGLEVFQQLKIDQYEFEFEHALSPTLLMTLTRKLPCPYYLKGGRRTRLIMFGSEQAVIYAMYGDMDRFLTYLMRS